MKLLQKGYNEIQALEVELRILEQTSAPPSRPRKLRVFLKILQFSSLIRSHFSFPLYFQTSFLLFHTINFLPTHLDAIKISKKNQIKNILKLVDLLHPF